MSTTRSTNGLGQNWKCWTYRVSSVVDIGSLARMWPSRWVLPRGEDVLWCDVGCFKSNFLFLFLQASEVNCYGSVNYSIQLYNMRLAPQTLVSNVTTYSTEFYVDNLHPFTTYELYLQASNEGKGKSIQASAQYKTKELGKFITVSLVVILIVVRNFVSYQGLWHVKQERHLEEQRVWLWNILFVWQSLTETEDRFLCILFCIEIILVLLLSGTTNFASLDVCYLFPALQPHMLSRGTSHFHH